MRTFNKHGIARHRAMHRDKKETIRIEFSDGRIESYPYGEEKK